MLRRLMAAESMYYESLASARYVEGEQNQTFARSVLVVYIVMDGRSHSYLTGSNCIFMPRCQS